MKIDLLGRNGTFFVDLESENLWDRVDIEKHVILPLSRITRYNGQYPGSVKNIYTVAQHSLLVLELYEKLFADAATNVGKKLALTHDFPEAFIGDMVGPIKETIPYYQALDDTVSWHMKVHFCMDPTSTDLRLVKCADTAAYIYERFIIHRLTQKQVGNLTGDLLGADMQATLYEMYESQTVRSLRDPCPVLEGSEVRRLLSAKFSELFE